MSLSSHGGRRASSSSSSSSRASASASTGIPGRSGREEMQQLALALALTSGLPSRLGRRWREEDQQDQLQQQQLEE
jgi:hypothetical protein